MDQSVRMNRKTRDKVSAAWRAAESPHTHECDVLSVVGYGQQFVTPRAVMVSLSSSAKNGVPRLTPEWETCGGGDGPVG